MLLEGFSLVVAAAAKLLQSYLTLRPHRRQPTRLPCPWDSPGKNNGVGCLFLLQCRKVKVKPLSCVRLLATPWTAAYQAPPSMGLSRQVYWRASCGKCRQLFRCAGFSLRWLLLLQSTASRHTDTSSCSVWA